MKRIRKSFIASMCMLAAFVLWTVAICFVDVRAIGPQGSSVGFASINGFVHNLTGVQLGLYNITDWLGLVPIFVCMGFSILGLIQWIKRKSICKVNELLKDNDNVTYAEDLHLGVSLRSYRAEKLSAFVHALLSFDESAATLYDEIKEKYPIVLTRDMAKARKWLHDKVRGTERTGVLVTKESARFKPLAIHVLPSGDENAVHWFLDDKSDVRSSNYLEDAATEIQVQGLELDYTCLLWDADMRYENGDWHFYRFNGQTRWTEQNANTESKQELQKYMLNAYRVLLTRARAGMVICVPEGNPNKTVSGFWEDSTRLPEFYNGTYEYLKSLGIEEI